MGLIVNKPVPDVSLHDLLDQMSICKTDLRADQTVHFGGPVEPGRGFVLHTPDYHSGLSSLAVTEAFSMTSTVDILEDVGQGNGPSKAIYALGYAGWGAGQLEGEIASNGWLTVQAEPELIFDTGDCQKWRQGLTMLGIDPAILSSTGGSA